jgi:hypothetical protein
MTDALIVGRDRTVVDRTVAGLREQGWDVVGTTDLDGVRGHLATDKVPRVITGAGLDLDIRLRIISYILAEHPGTSIHLKDKDSGPDGLLPFALGVLRGTSSSSANR